jgi:hypothetical protein
MHWHQGIRVLFVFVKWTCGMDLLGGDQRRRKRETMVQQDASSLYPQTMNKHPGHEHRRWQVQSDCKQHAPSNIANGRATWDGTAVNQRPSCRANWIIGEPFALARAKRNAVQHCANIPWAASPTGFLHGAALRMPSARLP